MPDFTAALRARMTGDAGVSDIVGQRVHWGIVPGTSPLPYIRLQVISDPRPEHLKGYAAARVSRVQADCFAQTYGQSRQLAEAVVAALAQPGVTGGIHFGRIKAEGPRDMGEDVAGIGFINRASLDLLVEHRVP